MAGSSAGFGSALALRAKEAMQRARTADALGLGTPLPTGQGASTTGIAPFVASAQPVANPPAASNPPLEDRMLGMVESFLAGLQTETYGEKPHGPAPTTILPDEGIGAV